MLNRVSEFYTAHLRYPEAYPAKDDPVEKELALWCEKQRSVKSTDPKDRGSSHWSNEKEAALEKLENWYWDRSDVNEPFWNNMYQYLKKNGLPARKSTDKVDKMMHKWILVQRKRNSLGQLDLAKSDLLSALSGWVWKVVPTDDSWYSKLNEIHQFYKDNGRLPEQFSYDKSESTLYKWLISQKKRKVTLKSDGTPELSESKQKAFEQVPTMSWDNEPDTYWDRMYSESVAYYDTYGKFKTSKDSDRLDKKVC